MLRGRAVLQMMCELIAGRSLISRPHLHWICESKLSLGYLGTYKSTMNANRHPGIGTLPFFFDAITQLLSMIPAILRHTLQPLVMVPACAEDYEDCNEKCPCSVFAPSSSGCGTLSFERIVLFRNLRLLRKRDPTEALGHTIIRRLSWLCRFTFLIRAAGWFEDNNNYSNGHSSRTQCIRSASFRVHLPVQG